MESRTHLAASLSLVALVAACSGGGGGGADAGTPGAVTGSLLLVPASPIAPLVEVEPNDGFDEPQPAGEIAAGRGLTIQGATGAEGGFDGFAFVARRHVRVRATLAGAGRAGATLFAFDPASAAVLARGDGALDFEASGPFDVVVRGAPGGGAYELAVAGFAPSASEPFAGWLGALSVGERATFRGGSRREITALEAGELVVKTPVGGARVARRGGAPEAGERVAIAIDALERVVVETPAGARVEVEMRPRTDRAASRPAALGTRDEERAALGLAAGEPVYGRAPENAKAGEALVRPRAGADVADDLARRGYARIGQIGDDVLQVAVDLDAIPEPEERARATVALLRSLGASPRVEYAELNRLRRPFGGAPPFQPNDGFYPLQWHYPLIRLPQAWGEARALLAGSPNVPPVRVAVIDTGRRPHVDLDANTNTALEYDFITDPTIAADGGGPDADAFDVGDGEGIVPSSFHGTHVAGTIAALTNNGGSTIAGVGSVPVGLANAGRVQVVHLRVLGKGGGTDADIARAIRYACGLQNPGIPLIADQVEVINLSLGGPGFNQTVQNAVTDARDRGVVVFAAAGNENSSAPSYPAAYANVVSVAAVDQNAARAPYSNFHASVDLAAPGGDTSVNTNPGSGPGQDDYVDGVLSTLVDAANGNPIYVFYQGTSMACPHAAGLAALMLVVNPVLTPAQVESKLAETALDLGTPGRDVVYGEGLIDALGAVRSAAGSGPGTAVLSVNPVALSFGTQATSLQLSLRNDGGFTIDVTSFTANPSWIGLVPGPAGTGIDLGSLTVVVDRDDPAIAADGTYTGSVSIVTSAGNATVPVTVVVETPVLPDVDLYVIAVDLSQDPPLTVAQTIVNPSLVGLDYVLDELSTKDGNLLPPGEYLIACGSDDDADLFLCGTGDVYCGLYPTLNDPALVRVDGSADGIDFVVAPLGSGSALTAFRGFARLVGQPAPSVRE